MLGKLMKHEFRATGRVGLPLCGIMLALSVLAGMTLRFWDGRENAAWWDRTGSIIITLYGMSIFAVAVGVFIVLMQHYKRNLLGDEGYLMRTLPASTHELLLSKLFVALLWYVGAAVLIGLSSLLAVALSGKMDIEEFRKGMEMLRTLLSRSDAGMWLSAILGGIGGMALFTLLFYADFTLSQTFSKHKVLYNVAGVVIFLTLLRLLFSFNGFLDSALFHSVRSVSSPADVGIIGGADGPTAIFVASRPAWIPIIELYLGNAALYFLTWAFLKYRPNIE